MEDQPDFGALVGSARARPPDYPPAPRRGSDLVAQSESDEDDGEGPVDSLSRNMRGLSKGSFSARHWASRDGKFFGAGDTVERLESGVYSTALHPNLGPFLTKRRVRTDNLLRFPDSASDSVLEEIRQFWSLKQAFLDHGFLHKRGVLLWGPPGSGKTSCINHLMSMVIEEEGGIAVMIEHPVVGALCLDLVRKIEPERPIIALLEDLDALVEQHGEQHYLALLDGESQVDNVVFVGTTNYPEKLDPRFVDRPSRFDTVMFVGMPSEAARRMYFQAKVPSLPEGELEHWVSLSRGYSVAHLREMIVSVRCFKRRVEDVVERLDKMRVRRLSSEDAPRDVSLGFSSAARAA